MRDHDKKEVLGVLPEGFTPSQAGSLCFLASGDKFSWTASHDGALIGAFGLAMQSELTPWLWSAWAFGTGKFRRAVPEITRFGRKNWAKIAHDIGIQRIEIRSHIDHDIAHEWLQGIGAIFECELTNYGRENQTYKLWSLIKEDFPCAS